VTSPARVPGKRGRRPAKRVAIRYIHQYATAPLAAPAYPVDVTGGIPDHAWGMLGNGPDPTCTTNPDGVGDCGFASREHYKYAKAACYGEQETRETADQLVTEYLTYDDGQDQGVILADVLLAWYKAGKILAFAPVDHTDPAACDTAMQEFKGLYVGVDLTDDAEDLFTAGEPWTVAAGQQPNPQDGHCILKVRADGTALDDYVTWGAAQQATRDWSTACLQEAWVVITSEDEAAKVDMAALLADITALDGTGPATP